MDGDSEYACEYFDSNVLRFTVQTRARTHTHAHIYDAHIYDDENVLTRRVFIDPCHTLSDCVLASSVGKHSPLAPSTTLLGDWCWLLTIDVCARAQSVTMHTHSHTHMLNTRTLSKQNSNKYHMFDYQMM